jgi:hypothetical protein
VEPRREPETGCGLEDPPGLLRAEHAALAEDVARPGDALGNDARQLLGDDAFQVGLGRVWPVAKLRRHGVRTKERGHDLDRTFRSKLSEQGQQPELSIRFQPVARLCLDRRDAV